MQNVLVAGRYSLRRYPHLLYAVSALCVPFHLDSQESLIIIILNHYSQQYSFRTRTSLFYKYIHKHILEYHFKLIVITTYCLLGAELLLKVVAALLLLLPDTTLLLIRYDIDINQRSCFSIEHHLPCLFISPFSIPSLLLLVLLNPIDILPSLPFGLLLIWYLFTLTVFLI